MNLRHTMKGRRTAVAIATGLVLTVAGCGGGGSDDKASDNGSTSSPSTKGDGNADEQESQTPTTASVLAEVKGENGVTLTVTSAQRDAGGFVTVEGTVVNNTGEAWVPANWLGDERELAKNGASIAGANLVDQAGKKKYLVLRDTSGRCLCTQFTGGVDEGATAQWFAQFPAPPDSTTSVDFQVGSMPPATIELSEDE
ncbi:hypothetical protein F9278_32300 [Streptomyces phaeolivaceus]|uniref:DUF4352 domain-containing protein n=1 Tax=Streptomyces phaeolivaceus TaxID=2653200 RepID=A0A5P8K9T2_9ACTN|nr:hypothetical protein [Streptomyces phaeolivaceus]QFR00064.1 hypothetical protein F9278_32300 [Streptomyces phaeolivaceus]